MSKISFESAVQAANNSNRDNTNSVGFFNLKRDKEEAIVRFMEDSSDNFEILSVHKNVPVGDKTRTISCVRGDHDPVDQCPLCAKGSPLTRRFFVKMIQYKKDDTGNVVAQPVMWERPVSTAVQLNEYIQNYGPLSHIMCKVIRNGAPGEKTTKYSFVPNLNPSVYREDLYPTNREVFEKYSALGSVVMDRTREELEQFMVTGEFPARERKNNSQPTAMESSYVPESISSYGAPEPTPAPAPTAFNPTTTAPQPANTGARMPWESGNGGITRPARYMR